MAGDTITNMNILPNEESYHRESDAVSSSTTWLHIPNGRILIITAVRTSNPASFTKYLCHFAPKLSGLLAIAMREELVYFLPLGGLFLEFSYHTDPALNNNLNKNPVYNYLKLVIKSYGRMEI
jgi:hypothetical protein